jgi:hypothetical protein
LERTSHAALFAAILGHVEMTSGPDAVCDCANKPDSGSDAKAVPFRMKFLREEFIGF